MSLGLGIFLSVVVAIVGWQIDKRNAWRKVAIWLAALLIVVIALFLVAGYWGNGRDYLRARSEKAAVLSGQLDTYMGLKLGMTQQEVRHLWGEPTDASWSVDGKTFEDGREIPSQVKNTLWGYETSPSGMKVAIWNKSLLLERIGCTSDLSYECPKVAGVGVGDDESAIIEALGAPPKEPHIYDDDTKWYMYSSLRLGLTQGRVFRVVVALPKADTDLQPN